MAVPLVFACFVALACLFLSFALSLQYHITKIQESMYNGQSLMVNYTTLWLTVQEAVLPRLNYLSRPWAKPWSTIHNYRWTDIKDQIVFSTAVGGPFSSSSHLLWTGDNSLPTKMTISDAPLCDTELRLQDLDQEKAYLESPSRSPCWKHYNAKVALSAMRSFQNQTEAAAAQETQHVITHWMETAASNDTGRIENIHKACNRLSLHVLSEVLYGVELRWPHDSQYVPPQGEKSISECGTDYILEGCHFSYRESLDMAEANAPVIDALPACLLKLSPLPALRAAYQARRDRHSYMRSLVVSKRQDQASGITTKPYSLIDLLLSPLSPAYLPTLIPKPDPAIALATSLFPLANPSETALLLSTAILHLALHPSTQSLLQSHLSHPHKPRTHDSPTPPLLTAILHETSLHLCSTPSNPTLWDPLRWLSPKPPLPMPTIKLPPLATTLGTTVLATLFSSHSIELHHFAAEAALPDLRPLERRRVWEGVRGWALEMIRRGEGARVGVRLVRRGEERCRF